jgi:hypothetical protein
LFFPQLPSNPVENAARCTGEHVQPVAMSRNDPTPFCPLPLRSVPPSKTSSHFRSMPTRRIQTRASGSVLRRTGRCCTRGSLCVPQGGLAPHLVIPLNHLLQLLLVRRANSTRISSVSPVAARARKQRPFVSGRRSAIPPSRSRFHSPSSTCINLVELSPPSGFSFVDFLAPLTRRSPRPRHASAS